MTSSTLAARAADVLFATPLRTPAIVNGQGAWVTADDGRRYLDAVAGPAVNILGHAHPRVIDALERQGRRLVHSSFHLNEPMVALAERLVHLAGPSFSRVFFANSGSHAVEAAVTLARRYSTSRGRHGHLLVALEGAHHGRSGVAIALSDHGRPDPEHASVEVVRLPIPTEGDGVADIERALQNYEGDDLLAVVAEPVLGVGGAVTPPPDFLRALRSLCTSSQALLIFDEVFTGFGRTGTMFAFESTGVEPDVLVVGKALGGDLPIGAVVAPEEIATSWEPAEHSTTFGANAALSAAAALAVLDEVVEANLSEVAAVCGSTLLSQLQDAAVDHPHVADVRGRGLLLGVELTQMEQAIAFKAALQEAGILSVGGPRWTVRLTPPLNLTRDEEAFLGNAARNALAGLAP